MATGWVKLNGKYYFMNGSGEMQHDTWVDNGAYYVNSDGVWVEGKTSQNRAESSRTDSAAGWVSGGGPQRQLVRRRQPHIGKACDSGLERKD